MKWYKSGGEAVLEMDVDGTRYQVSFSDDRYLSGMVNFWDPKNPPLVKSFMGADYFMEQMEKRASTSKEIVELLTVIESYQFDALKAASMTPEYATEVLNPDFEENGE